LHDLAAMGVWPGNSGLVEPLVVAPSSKSQLQALVDRAGFLVTGRVCKKQKWPTAIYRNFVKAAVRGKEDLWVRRPTKTDAAQPDPATVR
jgi:hypothetical protein